MIFKPLTDEEIKKLAEDIYRGVVYTDRHINNSEDVSRVFMPLLFLKKDQIDEINANPPGMIYEYMDQALPRSINGMPMFMSLRLISQEDAKKVNEKYIQIKDIIEKIH